MTTLGIDYGRAKLGFSLSLGGLASPLRTEKVGSWEEALRKVEELVKVEKVDLVVVGISEGEMGQEQRRFVQELEKRLSVSVETWDETLSTQDAQIKSLEAGVGRKKRHTFEDAYASAVMLQSYLEAHVKTNSKDSRSV